MTDMRPVFGMSKEEQEALAARMAAKERGVEVSTAFDLSIYEPKKPSAAMRIELSAQSRQHFERLIIALQRDVTFQVGSYDKRFVRNMYALIQDDDWQLTERQANYLDDLQWRYRRQLPRDFNPEWDGKK